MDVVGLRLTRAEPRSDTSAVAAHPLHRIANNGDDVQNDASKNPRRFANCSKIRAKRKGEPVPRVAVERATRVVVVDRAEEEIALRACDPPSVFAPSRGTRSRRISETLRHSSATKRIDAMTAPLPFLFSFDRTTSPPSPSLSPSLHPRGRHE